MGEYVCVREQEETKQLIQPDQPSYKDMRDKGIWKKLLSLIEVGHLHPEMKMHVQFWK